MSAGPAQATLKHSAWRARALTWAAPLAPRLGTFWRWWCAALLAWLPDAVRDAFGLWPQRLLLREQDGVLELTLFHRQAHDLGMLVLDEAAALADPLATRLPAAVAELPRWLLLPADTVLRRRLRLPAAAGEHLRDVTAFEIDRQTPFSSADVVHDARLVSTYADGQIEAELIVLPHAALDAALARLGPLAARLSGVDVAATDGPPLGINLLPATRRYHGPHRAWRRQWALLALSTALLVLALWQVLDNRHEMVLEWQRRVDARNEAAREIAQAERQALELSEGATFLAAERARHPGMVALMAELARQLPETTYLDKLAIEDGRMTLMGLSTDAPALVGHLQESPLWHSPALAGAVHPDPATHLDRFILTAELTLTEGRHVHIP